MLKRWLVLLGLATSGLIAAACAETGSAIATAQTAQIAQSAATQAYAAATQMVAAATQSFEDGQIPVFLPQFSNSFGNKTIIIDLPRAMVVLKNGQEVVVMKQPPLYETGAPTR